MDSATAAFAFIHNGLRAASSHKKQYDSPEVAIAWQCLLSRLAHHGVRTMLGGDSIQVFLLCFAKRDSKCAATLQISMDEGSP